MAKGKIVHKKKKLTIEDEFPERVQKKREHIEELANSMRSLKNQLTRDMKSEDEKTRITALVVAIILETSERIGNSQSANELGHFGVTFFRKKHVTISGNTVTLNYKGKSGVDHEKTFTDALIAKTLKETIKNSPTKEVFVTSEGVKINAERVNAYLDEYGITNKDLRSFNANNLIIEKLEKQKIADEEKERQKTFNNSARLAAIKVGHGYATLKKHYMLPELETKYVSGGKIIDLRNL